MEAFDHSGWLWGLSLIVLTMAIHATAIVILAFVLVSIRMRLESRHLKVGSLIAVAICVIGVTGLLLAVRRLTSVRAWAALSFSVMLGAVTGRASSNTR